MAEKSGIMTIQKIAEKILEKNSINPDAGDFYLKLQNSVYMDLVIERNGDTILIGHYTEENGDLISDPVLAMFYNGGYWYPMRIEQIMGDTEVSFIENGKQTIYPARVREFKSFAAMFARNIKEHGWLDAKVKERKGAA